MTNDAGKLLQKRFPAGLGSMMVHNAFKSQMSVRC